MACYVQEGPGVGTRRGKGSETATAMRAWFPPPSIPVEAGGSETETAREGRTRGWRGGEEAGGGSGGGGERERDAGGEGEREGRREGGEGGRGLGG